MRALFIPFAPDASGTDRVSYPWQSTEFQIVALSHDAPGTAPAFPGATVSGPSLLTEQTVAAASRAGLRESVNVGEGVRTQIDPAKASNATVKRMAALARGDA